LYPKCTKTHLRASVKSKYFPGVIPRTAVNRGWGWGKEKEGRKGGKRRGRKWREGKGNGGEGRGCHEPDQVWEEIEVYVNVLDYIGRPDYRVVFNERPNVREICMYK